MASAQAWRQHVEAWQASGLTQAAYCRQQGLNPFTFTGWRRRLTATPATSPGVIPIRVSLTDPASAAAVVLRLASGHQLELPASTAPAWLAELIRCLA
jgi:hypothetical protein